MNEQELQTDEKPGRRARRRAAVALAIFVLLLLAVVSWRPDDLFLWIKALHVIAVISWMAGLLYLPRLFIYHTDAPVGSVQSETFKMMEQRLYRVIMNPAMMLSWILGLYLAWTVYEFQGGWLHAKIAMVFLLTIVHVMFGRSMRRFAQDGPRRTARYWRLINEIPTVLMIVIVILVIVKPF
ncbi:protoporphyrinogen oxidase HemJ [Neorhizobium sp. JUb45]|uniref:protoporphyrinogen oxidase HemJ n=1 Tax=unclassified Neorhizobium TaxID=2629175 RepID=UPI00104CD960|nr:protoporphyrinogen oxidase HemJ [Neorhizobium sp. JUb45]TCQ99653.1 putative membrane protein [Neorhizobium sp. JUb45]